MKYYYTLILLALISFCACTEKNNPEPQIPWNETGYMLDSVISIRDGETIKSEYYYSVSSEHSDSSYNYTWNNNQWMLSSKTTCRYDSKWNVTESTISNLVNAQWLFVLRISCNYDSIGNTIEEIHSNYNTNRWIPSVAYYSVYNQDKNLTKYITINYDNEGTESSRFENQYEYDSFGNTTFQSSETYIRNLVFHSATKYDNYYTDTHLDSVYTYRKDDEQTSFECSSKSVYTNEGECSISTSYNFIENQFVLASKYVCQYDSHNNQILSNLFDWQNNEWVTRWLREDSYQYLPGTDLLSEYTRESTDYYITGEVLHINVKEKYYYTKL